MAKVVHFEIPVDDAERAGDFYRQVLGWRPQILPAQEYWLVQAGRPEEPGADGAFITRSDLHAHPVLVVGVADLDDALGRVEQAGGEVLQGRLEIPGVGWSAYVRDSEGNTIGLFQPAPGSMA